MTSLRVLAAGLAALFLSSASLAQGDPAAKAKVQESAKAIKAVQSMTFKSKRDNNLGGIPLKSDAEIKFIRTGPAANWSYLAKGVTEIPMEGRHNRLVAFVEGGKNVIYVDETAKTVWEGPLMARPENQRENNYIRQLMFLPPLVENEPFEAELKGMEFKMEPPAQVHGEMCEVVRIILQPNSLERVISISPVDHLPRRVEQIRIINPNNAVSMSWEIWDVNPDAKLSAKDFTIATPEGFKRQVIEAPKPVVDNNPVKPLSALPSGGPAIGSDAPAWALPAVDKPALQSDSPDLKGKVVVLGFWGAKFPKSADMLKTLAAVQTAAPDAKIFSVACRDTNEAAVKAHWASNNLPATLGALHGGDQAAEQFKLRGFPSVCVINNAGKVAAFFEAGVTAEQLNSAVQIASKGGVMPAAAAPAAAPAPKPVPKGDPAPPPAPPK